MSKKSTHQLHAQIAQLKAENLALQLRLKQTPEKTQQKIDEWIDTCKNANDIEELDLLLGDMSSYLAADGATLTLYDISSNKLNLISAYPVVSPNIKAEIHYNLDEFPWTWDQLSNGHTVILNSLDDIPTGQNTDIESYELLKQPSSLQIPIIFEGEIQSLFEFHAVDRTHYWQADDEILIKKIAPHIFSAATRFFKSSLDSESLSLLNHVLRTTNTSYILLNKDRSEYRFGSTMPEMLNLSSNTRLTPQEFDKQWSKEQLDKTTQWWNDIFNHERLNPIILKFNNDGTNSRYFKCTPSIILRNTNGLPEKILIGFSDISQQQSKTNNLKWLGEILKELHKTPCTKTIKRAIKELITRLNASGIMISINYQILFAEFSNEALVTNAFLSSHADGLNLLNTEICDIVKTKNKLSFRTIDKAPTELTSSPKILKAMQHVKLAGLYALAINRQAHIPAYMAIDWDQAHTMPDTESIESILSPIGDAIITALDQMNDKKALQNKIETEQWTANQIDKLYKSTYPINHTVEHALENLCDQLNVERVFIRNRIKDTDTYRLNYEFCKPNIASITETVGVDIELKNLPPEHILISKKPVFFNDIDHDKRGFASLNKLVLNEDPIKATLMMPLSGIEDLASYIVLDCMSRPHIWTEEQQQIALAIGSAICMANDRQDMHYQLLNSEQRFSMAMDASQDGIWDWQLESNQVYVSPGFLKLLGYNSEGITVDFDNELLAKRVHPDDKAAFVAEIKKIDQGLPPFEDFKFRFTTTKGKTLWCYSRAQFSDWDEQGKPKRLIGVLTNINDFVEQQQALEIARTDAEKANIEKNDFLARMSHEIRTPMNAIIGLSHLFKDTSMNDQQQDYIEHINSAANNLLGIINDILDFSKIEAGKLSIDNANFNFTDTLMQVIRISNFLAEQKSLKLSFHHDNDIPNHLFGDKLRLSQILTNLLSNAVKFTEQGEIILETQLLKKDTQQALININVIDSGMGISKDYIEHLFDPFTQADGSISRRFGGTGLGLTIVQRLAKLMGGDIQVDSHLGQGTRFSLSVKFPIATQAAVDSHQIEDSDDFDALSQVHVLIAEDNIVNQKVAAGILNKRQVQCSFANNGQEAIDILESNPDQFDAIFMDIEMPELNGYQACEYIRNNLNSTIPIIAMTAHAMADDEAKALNAGMNAHISKPINPNNLYQTLLRFVETEKPA